MNTTLSLPSAIPFQRLKPLFEEAALNNASRSTHIAWGWKDLNSVWQAMSLGFAAAVNLKPNESAGRHDTQLPHKVSEFSDIFIAQDQKAMREGAQLNLDMYPYQDNVVAVLMKKIPMADADGATIGVFMQTTFLRDENLIELADLAAPTQKHSPCISINLTSDTSVFTSQTSDSTQVSLSSRENECLFYLLRGFTLRHTAEALALSPRTIETYVNNLKVKFDCKTKPELIEKAISHGYLTNMPITLLSQTTLHSLRDKR